MPFIMIWNTQWKLWVKSLTKKYSGKKEGDKLNVPIFILFAQNFHFEKICTKEDVKVKYHCLRISISYMKHFDMPIRLIYLKHTIKLQEECISRSNERCTNLNLIWNLICFMRSVVSSYFSNWNCSFRLYCIQYLGENDLIRFQSITSNGNSSWRLWCRLMIANPQTSSSPPT